MTGFNLENNKDYNFMGEEINEVFSLKREEQGELMC